MYNDPEHPQTRYHEGTLKELHKITTSLSADECPPLNAISLPLQPRTSEMPSRIRTMASHEVAQSRVPKDYRASFDVPHLRDQMEWCLVGGRGAVSPFHVDAEGLNTVVMVLDGEKYWIVIVEFGEDDAICAVHSLGPTWNPYTINDGDNARRFRFEAVLLRKGDML